MFILNITWGSSDRTLWLWLLCNCFIFLNENDLLCHYKTLLLVSTLLSVLMTACLKCHTYPRFWYRMIINWGTLDLIFQLCFRMSENYFDLINSRYGNIKSPFYLTFRILEWYKLWLSKSLHMWKAQQFH